MKMSLSMAHNQLCRLPHTTFYEPKDFCGLNASTCACRTGLTCDLVYEGVHLCFCLRQSLFCPELLFVTFLV